ncbi:MAG TPA: GNAT family N-acetyltransferase, partial [Edaphobacter sp.]
MVNVQEFISPAPLPLLPASELPQTKETKDIRLEAGPYVARLALTQSEREHTYRLRFIVFNLEMNEGLESAFVNGLDRDRYDVCDHLIIEEKATGAIVGTYRLQMGDIAGRNFGYYSEQEFSFAPYE